jgi:macrolide transport system ATP-binding/permease protein
MDTVLQDFRYAVRMLARSRGVTAVAVLSLALGIGGNATVFTWARSVLLHPFSGITNSEQIVAVETVMPDGEYHTSSYPDYKDYRDQNQVFSGTIGFELVAALLKRPAEEQAQRNWGLLVTGNYFDVLGVPPALGRTFRAEEDTAPGGDPYVVLSDGFWRKRFAADPGVVGQTVQINLHSFTIIGVAPRNFQGTIVGLNPEYFVPMMMQPVVLPGERLDYRAPTFVHVMGRLKPGVSLEQARADVGTIAQRLAREYPDTNKNIGVFVAPVWRAHYGLQDFLLPVISFLMVVAVLVLLIACANVANLLLARAAAREKEISIRAALGASRWQLMRQFMAESLVLGFLSAGVGLIIAAWSANFLLFFLPPVYLPVGLTVGLDWSVLGFTFVLTLAAVMVFGLVPALQTSRPRLNESLKEGGRTSQSGSRRHVLRDLLVVSETLLAMVLLIGAGLLVRTVRNTQTARPGFNPEHVLLAAMDLRASGYTTEQQTTVFFQRFLERLRATPGVRSVSAERWAPLWFTGRGYTRPTIEGYTPGPNEEVGIDYNVVGPNYFSTMQIPLLAGREFTDADRLSTPRVALVNETMARRYWPGQNPIGRRLNSWDTWWTIAGVVKDIKYHSMNESAEPFLYFPLLQSDGTDANILVRTDGDANALLPAVQRQAAAVDPNVAVLYSGDLTHILSISLFSYRVAASVAGVLGILGLLLASLGLYGVLSYAVTQRTPEIGIRIALGAQRNHILELVVGQGMRLALIGVGLGLAAALTLSRFLASLLFGVSARDPLTFAGVALLLGGVALLACYVPARRAMRVDPMVALRHE